MKKTTRILIVEDKQADADLAKYTIQKALKNCEFQVVETREDFLNALEAFQPDVILSDYSLPRFDGMKALKLVLERAPLIPLIIWTGSISEDIAVECMKSGANNYILKENIKRLGPALIHALEERQLLLERTHAEEKYQNIIENSVEGIFQSTPRGRYLNVNPAMARIYGYVSPKEMIESITSIADQIYVDPKRRNEFLRLLDTQNVVENYEERNYRKDGSIIWTSTSARAVCDSHGNVLYYEGFIQDITQRKNAEAALQDSEERFRALIEHGLDNISLLQADGTLIWESPAAIRMLDYGQDEFVGRDIFALMHPEDLEWTRNLYAKLVQTPGSQQRGMFRLRRSDGTWRWVDAIVTNMLNEPSVNALVVNYRDITEQKQAEEALRESEERYRSIFEGVQDAVFVESLDGKILMVNERACEMFGYSRAEFLTKTVSDIVPEGHLILTAESSDSALSIEPCETVNRRANGEVFPVEISGRLQVINGETALLIVVRDITERKQAGGALQQSEARYRTLIETQRDFIVRWKPDGTRTFANEAYCNYFELTPEQAVSDSFMPLVHEDDRQSIEEKVHRLVTGITNVETEIHRVIRPDGQIGWQEWTDQVIRDENGQLAEIQSVGRDVTARRQAELERQTLLEIMQGLANTTDLKELLELIHHSIAKVIYARNLFVVLHNEEDGLFEEIYSVDQYDPPAPPSKLEKSITSYVFRSGEPLLLTQESFHRLVERGEIELVGTDSASWLGVPLKTSGRTVGVIAVQDYENDNRYSERDKEFLVSIASQIALAINHRQAVEAVRESETRYRGLFENLVIGFALHEIITDQDGQPVDYKFLEINPAFEKLTGIHADQAIGKRAKEVLAGIEKASFIPMYGQVALTGTPIHFEDFSERLGKYYEITAYSPKRGQFAVTFTDITERKQAEEALQDNEKRFRALIENGLDSISLLKADGTLIWESPSAIRLLDYAPDEYIGRNIFTLMHPDDLELTQDFYQKLVQGPGNHGRGKFRLRHSDGTWRWVEAIVTNMLGEPSVNAIVVNYRDITERKQAEERLRQSENRYRLATKATNDVIWEWTSEDNQLLWSENAQLVFGYSPEEIPAAGWWDEHIHPNDRERVISKLNTLITAGVESAWEDQYRFQLKNGSYACIDDHAYIERDPAGMIIRMIGAMSNITERKRAEDAEREQRALAEALRDTAETLNSTLDYGEVLDHILAAVGRVVPHDAATIMLIEGECARVVRARGYAGRGFDTAVMQIELPLAETINLQHMLETRRPFVISDTQSYPGWKKFTAVEWLRSNVGAPISIQAKVIGFVLLDSQVPGFFTPVHAERLEAFANQAALAIQNAQLLQQAQEEITERKRAEEAVRLSENKARALLNAIPDMMFRLDREATILDYKADQSELYAQSEPTLMGLKIRDISPPAFADLIDLYVNKTLESGEMQVFEYQLPVSNRGSQDYEARMVTSGKDEVMTIVRNITERKRAEEALHKSEALYRRAIEVAGAVPYLETYYDEGQKINYEFVGEGIRQITGYGPEEFTAELWDSLVEEVNLVEDLAGCSLEEGIRQVRNGEHSIWKCEHRLRDRYGKIHWVFEAAVELRDENGVSHGSIGTYQDITERKQAETELRASEERFRQLADNIQEAFWMTDAETGKEIYLSSAAENIWERPTEILMHEPNEFINSVFPEDQPAILHAIEKEKRGEKVEIEYRIILPNGSIRWVWDRAFPIFDEMGKVKRIAGITADITERRESELALVKSQSRYRELFDSSPISMWEEDYSLVKRQIDLILEGGVTDLKEHLGTHPDKVMELAALVRITDANKAALELYQIDRKEILLQGLTQVLSKDALSHFQEEILGFLSPVKRFVWEGRDQMLNGRQIDVLVTGAIPQGYEQDWSKVIISVSDITKRKQTEEEIRRRAKETAALLETSLALTNLDLEATLQTIGNSAKTLFAADGCRVFLMEPDGQSLRCVLALQENMAVFSNLRIKTGQGVTGAVAASGQAEIVNEMQNDPRSEQVAGTPQNEPEAIMFAPLKERDHTVGVLSIRRAGTERPFQSADLELLEAFASMAASAVSNARLFEETQRRLGELEALYENGLAVGKLLKPSEIGSRVINTFARYLPWHHVTIRLRKEESDELDLIAFNLPNLKEAERAETEQRFKSRIHSVGQGLSGWVMQTGTPFRTGDVHAHSQYIDIHAGIQSGLYMPLKAGERVIGVISVESEAPNAFTEQDERLLVTLANQTAIAFENARLYETIQKELSERKRAEQALRASEVHYRELADSITDILFELDQDLRYTHWNRASEVFSGILAEDVIGMSMQDLFGASKEQLSREEIYKSVLKERRARAFETEVFSQGQKRALEINAYPSARGVSVVAKDVTERKRSEIIMQKRFELMEFSAHHSLDELMQKTIDEVSELTGSSIGFLHFVDEDQVTLGSQTWSSSALRLSHVPECEGEHLALDRAGVWAEAARRRHPVIQNDYESLPEKKNLPQDHVPITRELVIPIIRNERIMAIMGIANKLQDYTQHDLDLAARLVDYAWDITERKQMELALEAERNQLAQRVDERTADLSRANSNLARALRVKDEFLANMSHELRTPLNAILGLSESLSEQIAGPLNEKQQKYISTISESGHHLLSLINDILDLAKIDAGQITLDINKVDIHSICQASLRMIKQLAQKKQQEVSLEIDNGLGLIWADERRLKQMLVNLLGNAVKFTPENGHLGLEVHGDEESNKISFTVWDNGVGIKEEDMARLFQPFVQLNSGLAREATGTGLGLALVAQMARLHGGSIQAVSEPEQGSRFTVVLPWEPALAMDAATRMKITGKFRAIKLDEKNKPTILLVEDTQEVTMMIKDYLELAGYKVVTAQDGVDAIVQAKLVRPDLILMDVQMPRMDGLEATRKLRGEPDFRYTPIIALTALAMSGDRERCFAAGMDEYISKPVNLKALIKIVQGCLFSNQEVKSG